MMPLAIVLSAVVIALLRGGSLLRLATLDIQAIWLAFTAFGLQLLLFSPFNISIIPHSLTPAFYIGSMLLLVVWVVVNRRVSGMWLVASGLVLNTIAIVANGGYMPVELEQARFAGKLANYTNTSEGIANNSVVLPQDQTHVWLLTDILALPAGVPLANVFSIGDVLLFLGIGLLCYTSMCRPSTPSAT